MNQERFARNMLNQLKKTSPGPAMNKKELYDHIPERMKKTPNSKSLKALELVFCKGMSVREAAEHVGAHRVTVGTAVAKVNKNLTAAGYKKKIMTRTIYWKP